MFAMPMRLRTAWRAVLIGLLLVTAHAYAAAAQSLLDSMAAAIGPAEARRAMTGIATRADGTGPRGAFTTEIVSLGDVVRFVQVRGDRNTSLLVTGATAFAPTVPGSPMQATSGPEAAFVRGHDLHRLLLDLETRIQVTAEDAAAGCLDGTAAAGRLRVCRGAGESRPSRLTLTSAGASTPVVIDLSDWRRVQGVTLPFAIDYRQGAERHTHRFVAVRPFTLAPGDALPADPAAAFDRLGAFSARP